MEFFKKVGLTVVEEGVYNVPRNFRGLEPTLESWLVILSLL